MFSIDLQFDPAPYTLPSNLRDTTDFSQTTQEFRLASDTDSPFQWLLGTFYSGVERDYRQRLPTPGYDAFQNQRSALLAGDGNPLTNFPTAAQTANGFPADSPYNSDLPYDITQRAAFGEGTYDITDRFNVTVGARYYHFSEERSFVSGGVFANGDNRNDSTSSDGHHPAHYGKLRSVTRHDFERASFPRLPPWRRQRSAQLATVLRAGRGNLWRLPKL